MEINDLASGYFDDYRLSLPMNGISEYGKGNGGNFEGILQKARDSQAGEAAETAEAAEAASVTSRTARIDKSDKLYEQCLELETFLVKTLVSGMRKTVQKSGLINEGFAGKMYEDMLYDEYAKEFTKSASFGLADQAYLELTGQRGFRVAKNSEQ